MEPRIREQEPELYDISANGFTAVTDAFALEGEGRERSLWLLSMIGSQATVRAISACITKMNPEPVTFASNEHSPAGRLRITARKPYQSGSWRAKTLRLPLSRAWHCIVYPAKAEFEPQEGQENRGAGNSFLVLKKDRYEQEQEKHHRFLNRRVSVPLHGGWTEWLWERGLETGETTPLDCYGRIEAWLCRPDQNALKKDISRAIRRGMLRR